MRNPYESLTSNKFWKTGVSSLKENNGFKNIWTSKFLITKETKIITLGSCFAQHISKWLIENEYSWQNAEPGPGEYSENELIDNGYNIYSCRVGNIYTPAMLKQWIELATDSKNSFNEIYYENNRYYDPLRPQIPKFGYSTKSELESARDHTLKCLYSLLRNSDVLIFTLGLTEGWVNVDGYVYQVCPGTIRGEFDSQKHRFINYTYDDVMRDMVCVIEKLISINKNIKLLLTVSPVPLTATASEIHVLPATIYSKSVLRAVSGDLASIYPNVDYFPSYELIVSSATKRNYFEGNFRTVKPEGVQFVMNHFGVGIGIFSESIFNVNSRTYLSTEDYCDDILIESWNRNNYDETRIIEDNYEYFLIGDSHMGKLLNAFSGQNTNCAGGMIMNGSAWTSNLLHIDENEIFVPLENSESRKIWSKTLSILNSSDKKRKVILNIGMQSHRSVRMFYDFLSANKITNVTSDLFVEYFMRENHLKIEIIKRLIELGHDCLVVSDPPTRKIDNEISKSIEFWKFYDEQSLKIFHELGCNTFNASLFFKDEKFEDKFISDVIFEDGTRDWFHGSDEYYLELSRVIKSNYFL